MNAWPHIERSWDLLKPTGERVRFIVRLGPAYEKNAHYYCPVRFEGWGDSPPDIEGRDALQSLLIAVDLVRSILHAYVTHGGRVLWPDTNTDYDLVQFG